MRALSASLRHSKARALSVGFDQLAIGLLEAFVNQVQASIGFGSVSAEDGAQLINSAEALIASISG